MNYPRARGRGLPAIRDDTCITEVAVSYPRARRAALSPHGEYLPASAISIGNKPTIRACVDSHRGGSVIPLDGVAGWLEIAHTHVRDTFEVCIKDSLRDLFTIGEEVPAAAR